MSNTRLRAALLAVAASLALAACGGGGGSAEDNSVAPDSASASNQGFFDYIASLASRMLDDSEPVDVSAVTMPPDNVDDRAPHPTSIDE
ncbi:hypothetical protein [Methylibium sp. Root1272]|uniref:hypothetical protein n=1 Tax=Methylibium sp. Root1272 TaxID=1736441 RepID=UPI0006F70CBF|nr:hypothetical protein [Methylibium sp. Root1272]KQW67939.1 hypothetical protein ASC67_11225 [Methylibium sp. Root1272]